MMHRTRPDLFAHGLRVGFDHGEKIGDLLNETRELRPECRVVSVRLEHARETVCGRSQSIAHPNVLQHHGVDAQPDTIHHVWRRRGGVFLQETRRVVEKRLCKADSVPNGRSHALHVLTPSLAVPRAHDGTKGRGSVDAEVVLIRHELVVL